MRKMHPINVRIEKHGLNRLITRANRKLKQRSRRRQRERQKPSRFRLANNNFARASRFFVHFFAFTARLRYESAKLLVLWRTWTKTNDFIFLEPWYSLLEFNSRIVCQQLTNWTRWNKRDKVWCSANSLFKWRFRNRCRRCCLSSLLMERRRNLRALAGICEFHMTYF